MLFSLVTVSKLCNSYLYHVAVMCGTFLYFECVRIYAYSSYVHHVCLQCFYSAGQVSSLDIILAIRQLSGLTALYAIFMKSSATCVIIGLLVLIGFHPRFWNVISSLEMFLLELCFWWNISLLTQVPTLFLAIKYLTNF